VRASAAPPAPRVRTSTASLAVYRSRNLCAEQTLAISTRLEIAEGKGGRGGGERRGTAPSTGLSQCTLVRLSDLNVVEPVKRHASEWAAAGRQTVAIENRTGARAGAGARSPCRQRRGRGSFQEVCASANLHARQTPAAATATAAATANRIGSSASQPVGQKGARSSSVAGVQGDRMSRTAPECFRLQMYLSDAPSCSGAHASSCIRNHEPRTTHCAVDEDPSRFCRRCPLPLPLLPSQTRRRLLPGIFLVAARALAPITNQLYCAPPAPTSFLPVHQQLID
jgi:hypothetical protein